jgi:hypothetical protein
MPDPTALMAGGTTGIGLASAQAPHARCFPVMVTGRDAATFATARAALPGDVAVVPDAESIATSSGSPTRAGGRSPPLAFFSPMRAPGARAFQDIDEAIFSEGLDVNVQGGLLHAPEGSVAAWRTRFGALQRRAPRSQEPLELVSVRRVHGRAHVDGTRTLRWTGASRRPDNALTAGPIGTQAIDRLGLSPDKSTSFVRSSAAACPEPVWHKRGRRGAGGGPRLASGRPSPARTYSSTVDYPLNRWPVLHRNSNYYIGEGQ